MDRNVIIEHVRIPRLLLWKWPKLRAKYNASWSYKRTLYDKDLVIGMEPISPTCYSNGSQSNSKKVSIFMYVGRDKTYVGVIHKCHHAIFEYFWPYPYPNPTVTLFSKIFQYCCHKILEPLLPQAMTSFMNDPLWRKSVGEIDVIRNKKLKLNGEWAMMSIFGTNLRSVFCCFCSPLALIGILCKYFFRYYFFFRSFKINLQSSIVIIARRVMSSNRRFVVHKNTQRFLFCFIFLLKFSLNIKKHFITIYWKNVIGCCCWAVQKNHLLMNIKSLQDMDVKQDLS